MIKHQSINCFPCLGTRHIGLFGHSQSRISAPTNSLDSTWITSTCPDFPRSSSPSARPPRTNWTPLTCSSTSRAHRTHYWRWKDHRETSARSVPSWQIRESRSSYSCAGWSIRESWSSRWGYQICGAAIHRPSAKTISRANRDKRRCATANRPSRTNNHSRPPHS